MLKLSVILMSVLFNVSHGKDENVLMTEVFEIELNPSLFNWTYERNPKQFTYQASLLNAPDLPSWISYVFSDRRHAGLLYGVPPNRNATYILEIVALNKRNYETRTEKINIHVSEKLNPAKYEVHMKIDNLNVEDMFQVDRMESLKDVFRKNLWKNSQNDLYVTFLTSAIQLGARKPLNPDESDGVVLRLGSRAPFSPDLLELQEEVKPLWKVPSCPRDFKRTSVERYFRNAEFVLDWCSFRLIDDSNSALQQSNEKLKTELFDEDLWLGYSKADVPQRSYFQEIICTIFVPVVLLLVLVLVLSFILCFHHEGINDPMSEDFFNNLYHICTDYISSKRLENTLTYNNVNEIEYATIARTSESLRNLNCDSNGGSDTILRNQSPNATVNRGVHCRPSPPPYIRPKFKPDF